MSARTFLSLSAALLLTAASGCVVHVGDSAHCDDGCCYPETGGGPGAQVGNYAGAIRAANTLSYSSDRSSTLNTIAAKPDLDEPSQMMLVNSLRGSWGYSSDKAKVAETLVTNPALTPRTSLHIANHLERIVAYSSDRKKIADLLAARPLPTAAPAVPATHTETAK